jgi:hypothetical protein
MTEKKRRQGQRGATPKPICPKCGEYLRRCYVHESTGVSRSYAGAGWICPTSTCDYIIKDYVELEDEAEAGIDKAEKIKKLTDEFVKKQEQLNRLAEQINALENE